MAVEPGVRVKLEVRMGSFFPAEDRPNDVPEARWTYARNSLSVFLNGTSVFEATAPFFMTRATRRHCLPVGRNT